MSRKGSTRRARRAPARSPARPSLPARVLVVDDDPWVRQTAESLLEAEGRQVASAASAEEGLELALRLLPDVILVDGLLPVMDGWTLIEKIRSHERLRDVRVIFLSSAHSPEERIQAFRLGADDFMDKPFHPEELRIRVARALAHVARPAPGPGTPAAPGAGAAGIRGTLEGVGLASLLSLLELDRKSGLVRVERRGGEENARLYLREGRVVSVEVERGPELRNREAVYHLLQWPEGSFEYVPLPIEHEDELGMPTAHLLLEAARRFDESRRSSG